MWGARPRATRLALSTVVATALVFLTFGAVASSALAWGDHDHDAYTVNISPSSVLKDSSTTFDVALTNTSSPGSNLSSALIAAPLGFRITHVSLPTGASGHAYVFFNLVTLDRLSLAAGSTLHVAVTAIAPSRCDSPFTHWFTWANEGGFFSEDLHLDAANSSVTTTVTCDTATALVFSTQPNNTTVGQDITAAPGPSGVTVELVDSGGNVVDTSAPVTIAVGTNPSKGTLGGTLTESASHGIATFTDLTLDQPGAGYTLSASSTGLPGTTSNPFNENQTDTVDCPAAGCTHTLSTGDSSAQVDVGPGTADASLTESVDLGTPMDGPGSDPKNVGCASYTPPAGSVDWYGVDVSDSTRTKTITWTVNNAISDGFEICFGAPYDFLTGFGSDGQRLFAPAGTLPDGTTGFVGLLDSCNNLGDFQSSNPCWTSIAPGPNGSGTVAMIQIPAGLTGDPWFGR
jgi:hypothetical protein